MKSFFLHIASIIIFVTVCCPSCKNEKKEKGLDRVVDFEKTDNVMNAAVANARGTTDSFLHILENPTHGEADFFVKYPYPTPEGNSEHIWISAMTLKGNKILGVISNDAEANIGVNFGDTVLVAKDSISDWSYKRSGYTYGGYTLRVLRNTLSAQEQSKFDSMYQFK